MKIPADGTTGDTPEQLIAGLRSLLTEAEQMIAANAEFEAGRPESLIEHLAAAQENLQALCDATRSQVVAGAKRADTTIRAHPYSAMAAAAGVGVLVGLWLRRSD